jgi:hypothetical protein
MGELTGGACGLNGLRSLLQNSRLLGQGRHREEQRYRNEQCGPEYLHDEGSISQ